MKQVLGSKKQNPKVTLAAARTEPAAKGKFPGKLDSDMEDLPKQAPELSIESFLADEVTLKLNTCECSDLKIRKARGMTGKWTK